MSEIVKFESDTSYKAGEDIIYSFAKLRKI